MSILDQSEFLSNLNTSFSLGNAFSLDLSFSKHIDRNIFSGQPLCNVCIQNIIMYANLLCCHLKSEILSLNRKKIPSKNRIQNLN